MTKEQLDSGGAEAAEQIILMGIAPSNLANERNPGLELPDKFAELAALLGGSLEGFELEMEGGFEVAELPTDFQRPAFLGVHQPTKGIDVLSDQNRHQRHSVKHIQQAMDLAGHLAADYFTIHLQTVDRHWANERARGRQAAASLEVLEELLRYHQKNQFEFAMLVENLEYPKYPATLEEISDVAAILADKEDIPTGILLDVGHLWRSRTLIKEAHHKWPGGNQTYDTYLDGVLKAVGQHIRAFHVTGCHGHQTHLLPDLSGPPKRSVAEAALGPDYNEYDFRRVGATVLRFVAGTETTIPIVNEAIGYSYAQVLANNDTIRRSLGSIE